MKNNKYKIYNILYKIYKYYMMMKKFNKGENILINID
jgi:hypothetical protein